MSAIQAFLFDLDGTLLDSAPDLAAALNWVRASEGLPGLDLEYLSPYVSHGAAGMLKAGMPAADGPRFETWKSLFLARYAERSFELSRLYEGVPQLLDFLAQSGIPWGIVTNKYEALTMPILRATNLLGKTACVVCGDTLSSSKPDPAPVIHACNVLNVPLHRTLFAGDDMRDLQAGRAAGTMTAVVHYGYGSHDLGDALVADSVQVHHPRDLVELVRRQNA